MEIEVQKKILQKNNMDSDEFSLKELLIKIKHLILFLKTKWKILLIITFIGAVISLIMSYSDKPIYTATLTFAMEEDKGGGGGGLSGALGLASSFGIDLGSGGGGAFAASNLTELMKSRLIVEKVLMMPINNNGKIISLLEYYIGFNNLRNNWNKNSKLKNIAFPPNLMNDEFSIQQDSLISIIYKNLIQKDKLSIQQKDKKVSILTIEVNSEDEKFSKIFCENLAVETSNFYIETKSKKARNNVEVLQKQVDSVRDELNYAINGVAKEADNIYNLNPAFNIKGAETKKKQVDVQSNSSVLTQIIIQLELAKINLRKETPLIQLIDKPKFPLYKKIPNKLNSFILGGFVAFLISVLILIFYRIYKQMEI